jgi:serine/threonine-protein kinase
MPPAPEPDRDQALLEELVRRGWATEEQASEARRLKAAADELGQPATLDDLLARKGVAADRVGTVRRDLASRFGQTIRIGKYEILQRIGEGGSGIVYRAYQTNLGREVALKVLSQRREGEEEYLERFNREAQVAVTLNHVHIVRGLDFGYADGYHYFAMELVEGESLLSVIRREQRLPEKKALDLALQMVRALEHASKYRIVHRDIKPENILITRSGTAKLCDLGLARPILQGGAADSQGKPIGTALYVAPEQIRRSADLDFRADIYALGATLYHALTGVPPFTGQNVQEILRAHLNAPPPNPRDRVMDISSGTAAVVTKMLAKDPADRYPSLESLDEDLDSVLAGRPPVNTITIGKKPAPFGEGPARASADRRRRAGAGVLVGAGAAVLLLAGGAWFAFGRSKPAVLPPPPPPPPEKGPGGGGGAPDVARMREARENEASAALATAEAIAREKGAGPAEAEVEAALVALVASHPDTSAGRVAKTRLEDLRKAREARVRRDLEERGRAFDGALAAGRLGEARAAWEGLSPATAAAGGTARAAEARAKADAAARALLDRALEAAGKARTGDAAAADAARKALRDAEECGLPEIAEAATKERVALEAALAERDARLRAAHEAWPRTCAEVLAVASTAGPREAAALVDERAGLLAPLEGRADRLRGALADLASFEDAARGAFEKAAAAGETVRLRVAGRPGGSVAGRAAGVKGEAFEIQRGPVVDAIPIRDVAAEDVAGLAWRVLGTGTVRDHAGAAVFYLARGAHARAEVEARALEVLGAPEEAARARELSTSVRSVARARADAALREAGVLRLQDRLPEARAALERAAAEDLGYAAPLWRLGAFLVETGKEVAEALVPLEAAAALGPEEPEAWYWIGEARRRAGRLEESMAALDRYLAAAPVDDPRREAARKSLEELRSASAAAAAKETRDEAARAFRKEDFKAAEDLWRRVVAARPDDTEALYFHGKCLLALDRRVDGYAALRRFLAAERRGGSRVDDAKRIVRDLEQRLGDSEAAKRKALEGVRALDDGQWQEALAAFDAAVDLAPLRADTWAERGRALQFAWAAEGRKEHLHQALRDLETALLVNERHGRAWSVLAITRANLEDWEGAVQASLKSSQYDPGWPPMYEYRARACARTGRFAEADQAASEGIAKFPSAILHIARAHARVGLRRLGEARADLDLAASKFTLTPFEKNYRVEVLDLLLKAEKAAE